MGPERGPPVALHPAPGPAQHLADGRPKVVVADLAARHATQHVQRVDMALQEGLLPARRVDLLHGLPAERQAQREQEHLGGHPVQVDPHIPEVDLSLIARAVGLQHERLRRPSTLLDPDLRTAKEDVVPHHRVGHALRVVLVQQPVEDPFDGMPLLARRIQVHPQDLVDRQLERVKTRAPRRRLLPRRRPHRLQCQRDRLAAHPVLGRQSPAGQPFDLCVTADRRIQLDLGKWHLGHPGLLDAPRILPPQGPQWSQNSSTSHLSRSQWSQNPPSAGLKTHLQSHLRTGLVEPALVPSQPIWSRSQTIWSDSLGVSVDLVRPRTVADQSHSS
jgi:hypothetical protein